MQKLRAGVVTRVLAVAALTGLTLLGAVTVQAQSQSQNAAQNWPSKPVMLMVGSLAGSAPEVYARTVSEPMSRILGQPVLVEVRAGANGNVAAEFVARHPPMAMPSGFRPSRRSRSTPVPTTSCAGSHRISPA